MAQCVQQLDAVCGHGPPFAPDSEAITIQLHFQPVAEADEGVAGQPLTAFDALEQEARREGRKLHERRNRRIEVTRYVEGRFHAADSCLFLKKGRPNAKNPSRGYRRWVFRLRET